MTNPIAPQSAALFPELPLRHHLHLWWSQRKKQVIAKGDTFLAPDGQRFVVIGKKFWRYANRKKPKVSIIWQSHCQLCGARYVFNVPTNARSLVRTCEAHRRANRPAHKSPLRDSVTATLEALSVTHDAISHDNAIAACVAALPRGPGRDTRRQRVIRCLQELIDKRALPDGVTVGELQFMFASDG